MAPSTMGVFAAEPSAAPRADAVQPLLGAAGSRVGVTLAHSTLGATRRCAVWWWEEDVMPPEDATNAVEKDC